MKAICDKGCNKEFDVESLTQDKLEQGVIEIYFKCPYCNTKYNCGFTDKDIRYKQIIINQKRKAGVDQKILEGLQQEVRKDMGCLKAKMLGD